MTTPNPNQLRLILAPMEGVVDAVMREFLTGIGGYDRCVTEFVRVSSTVLPSRVFHRLCPELATGGTTPSGVPVYLQLLGSDPELMAANARRAAALGAPGIDLNFGCPAKTVNKSRGGAVLLEQPDLVTAICTAVRDAVPAGVPVTAKIRLGYSSDDGFESVVDGIHRSGINELIVHARTKVQAYRPPAHWHRVAAAVARTTMPVIANGELWTPSDLQTCRAASGCSAFMLARGALCRPDLARTLRALEDGRPCEALSWPEVLPMLQRFLERNASRYDPRHAVNPVKQWLVYLQHHYIEAGALFVRVKRINDTATMARVLAERPLAAAA